MDAGVSRLFLPLVGGAQARRRAFSVDGCSTDALGAALTVAVAVGGAVALAGGGATTTIGAGDAATTGDAAGAGAGERSARSTPSPNTPATPAVSKSGLVFCSGGSGGSGAGDMRRAERWLDESGNDTIDPELSSWMSAALSSVSARSEPQLCALARSTVS